MGEPVSFTLSCGRTTVVDEEDLWLLKRWKWRIVRRGLYVTRNAYGGKGKQKLVQLHRVINNTPEGLVTDHINGNTLDNRRSNLRSCTQRENCWNTPDAKKNRTGYRGVQPFGNGKWVARFWNEGHTRHIGVFETPEEAHEAYKAKIVEVRGQISWRE